MPTARNLSSVVPAFLDAQSAARALLTAISSGSHYPVSDLLQVAPFSIPFALFLFLFMLQHPLSFSLARPTSPFAVIGRQERARFALDE